MQTSSQLTVGHTYSREELAQKFGIKDATLFTGIFKPKGHESIWLFVTQEKTADGTQYKDELTGDDLYIEGQKSKTSCLGNILSLIWKCYCSTANQSTNSRKLLSPMKARSAMQIMSPDHRHASISVE